MSDATLKAGTAIDNGLGTTFRRVGWIGFWVQVVVGAIPIAVAVALFTLNREALFPGGRVDLISLLSVLSLLILVFSTIWSFRYTRVGASLLSEAGGWTYRRLKRIVGIGLVASGIGILFSIIVTLVEVVGLLVQFLSAPQAGVPVIQTTAGSGDALWISALDIQSLLALTLIIAAEIIVLLLGLWLLYRVASAVTKHAEAAQTP